METTLQTPKQVQALTSEGYIFLDVRSEVEFELGHVPGAYNIPLMQPDGDELVENPKFLQVVLHHFAKGAPIILGCHSGSRSRLAREQLASAGFQRLFELEAGWNGKRDPFGRLCGGWQRGGFPVEVEGAIERTYAALEASALASR